MGAHDPVLESWAAAPALSVFATICWVRIAQANFCLAFSLRAEEGDDCQRKAEGRKSAWGRLA